jgi:uncharacterized protein YoxC
MKQYENQSSIEPKNQRVLEEIFAIIKIVSGLPGVKKTLLQKHESLTKIAATTQDIIDLANQILNNITPQKKEIQEIGNSIKKALDSVLNPTYRGTQIFSQKKQKLEEKFLNTLDQYDIDRSQTGTIALQLWEKTKKEILRINE